MSSLTLLIDFRRSFSLKKGDQKLSVALAAPDFGFYIFYLNCELCSVHEGSYFEQNQEISICQSDEVFLVTYFDDPKEVTGNNPL